MQIVVDPDTQETMRKAVKAIDDQIVKFQRLRAELMQSFLGGSAEAQDYAMVRETQAVPDGQTQMLFAKRPNRKQQLAILLKRDGPLSRQDIVAKTGISKHTVNASLADKKFFRRDNGGLWYAV